MTDFRAKGTIMGLAGLTAVFGMGTGGTPPVWSPEIRPAGGEAGRARIRVVVTLAQRASQSSWLLISRQRWSPCGGIRCRSVASNDH